MPASENCIYGDCEYPAVTEAGFCGHHHWAARAEYEEGMFKLRVYLTCWARFQEWLVAHGR